MLNLRLVALDEVVLEGQPLHLRSVTTSRDPEIATPMSLALGPGLMGPGGLEIREHAVAKHTP